MNAPTKHRGPTVRQSSTTLLTKHKGIATSQKVRVWIGQTNLMHLYIYMPSSRKPPPLLLAYSGTRRGQPGVCFYPCFTPFLLACMPLSRRLRTPHLRLRPGTNGSQLLHFHTSNLPMLFSGTDQSSHAWHDGCRAPGLQGVWLRGRHL